MISLTVLRVFLLTKSCVCLQVIATPEKNLPLGYDPEEILARLFSNDNSTEYRQAAYSPINLENLANINAPSNEQGFGFINFEGQSQQSDIQNYNNNLVSFQDQTHVPEDNQIPPTWPHQKRKRRRRKPRLQQLPGSDYGLQHPIANGVQNVPFGQRPYGYLQVPNGQYYRPPYQSKPSSLAEDALAGIIRAMESVARYDDYQCVPRLLCEAAGGRTTKNSGTQSSLLSSFIDIQPLIMLLGAYSGISTSPLFVFGRAVLLGVSSKENNGVCRYAYPLCPTDPEQVVDYLNNHNGGFFRFFNTPPSGFSPSGFNGQPSLHQFYSQLPNIPHQNQQQNLKRPDDFSGHYGFHQPNIAVPVSSLYNNKFQSGYGFPQNYGLNYPYNSDKNFRYIDNKNYQKNKDRQKNDKIEKRIQNNPIHLFINTDQVHRGENFKWTFPESSSAHHVCEDDFKTGRILRFPEATTTVNRPIIAEENSKAKRFTFPGQQSHRQYIENHNHESVANFNEFAANSGGGFKYDESGYYVESNDFVDSNDFIVNNDDANGDVKVVYVVRGNSDPNNPEIVRLLPGQKII